MIHFEFIPRGHHITSAWKRNFTSDRIRSINFRKFMLEARKRKTFAFTVNWFRHKIQSAFTFTSAPLSTGWYRDSLAQLDSRDDNARWALLLHIIFIDRFRYENSHNLQCLPSWMLSCYHKLGLLFLLTPGKQKFLTITMERNCLHSKYLHKVYIFLLIVWNFGRLKFFELSWRS